MTQHIFPWEEEVGEGGEEGWCQHEASILYIITNMKTTRGKNKKHIRMHGDTYNHTLDCHYVHGQLYMWEHTKSNQSHSKHFLVGPTRKWVWLCPGNWCGFIQEMGVVLVTELTVKGSHTSLDHTESLTN